jgi:hypothetical protein
VDTTLDSLQQIADELRCLPDVYLVKDNRQLVSQGQQDNLPSWMQTAFLTIENANLCALEAHAGNLIVKAFKKASNLGGFRSSAHALLRACIERRQEPPDHNSDEWQRWAGAILDDAIRFLLPAVPHNMPYLECEACRQIADAIEAEIKRMETPLLAAKPEPSERNGGADPGRPAPKGEVMAEFFSYSSESHPVWTPFAAKIHEAVWDRVGLEKVREFVRKWADPRDEASREQDRIKTTERNRIRREVVDNWSESLELPRVNCYGLLPEALEVFAPPDPVQPFPLDNRASPLSRVTKWAGLAAIHDFYWMDDKINPFPEPAPAIPPWTLPPDDESYLEVQKAWEASVTAHNEALPYKRLLDRAGRLKDTDVVVAWLRELVAENLAKPPAAKPEQDEGEGTKGQTTPVAQVGAAPGMPQDEAGIVFTLDDPHPDPTRAVYGLDCRTVAWFGTVYTFTPTQAACVKILIKHYKYGVSEVGESTILENAESSQNRLVSVFDNGGHVAWGTMIVPGSTKGTFRLLKPEQTEPTAKPTDKPTVTP